MRAVRTLGLAALVGLAGCAVDAPAEYDIRDFGLVQQLTFPEDQEYVGFTLDNGECYTYYDSNSNGRVVSAISRLQYARDNYLVVDIEGDQSTIGDPNCTRLRRLKIDVGN